MAEGSWLDRNADGAYTGSSYHNVPLFLFLYELVLNTGADPTMVVQVSMIAIDVACTFLLFLLPSAYRSSQSREWSAGDLIQQVLKRKSKSKGLPSAMVTIGTTEKVAQLSPAPSEQLPLLLAAFYLLNPLSIMCCVAMSLQLPLNLAVIATAVFSCYGSVPLTSIFLALSIYMSPYLLVLVLPSALLVAGHRRFVLLRTVVSIFVTTSFLWSLLLLSYLYMGGSDDYLSQISGNPAWDFLERVYGFQFFVEDLQPNIGVSWYFHTEVFQHFRLLFLFVFQYHVFLYTIPICYKFSGQPMTAFWLLLTLASAFKPYPSAADVLLYLSLFPILNHLMNHMSYKNLIATAGITCACLLPVMWRMWIWTGTGNANFYFAICVGIAITNGLFITDVMESVLIRNFLIKQAVISNDAPKLS